MKAKKFPFQGEYLDGFREYLVQNHYSTKSQYISFDASSEKRSTVNLWNTSTDNFWTSSQSDEEKYIIFIFPKGSFSLDSYSIQTHNGPSRPKEWIVEGSYNNGNTYEEIDHVSDFSTSIKTPYHFNVSSINIYTSIKFKLINNWNPNQETEPYFILSCFDFFGTYIPNQFTINHYSLTSIKLIILVTVFIMLQS